MVYEMCRKFADEELAPKAGEWDKKHEFPKEAITHLVGAGAVNIKTRRHMV
jgi:butyryl-CoA dehydrogenase